MNLDRRIHILLFHICVTTLRLASGQDAEFSQFLANPLYMNPALTGTFELPRMSLNYRNQ